MLNEVYKLKCSLEAVGVCLVGTHPAVGDVKDSGLFVTIRKNGTLRVEAYDSQRSLWKYAPHNQMMFPAGKLLGPLLQGVEEISVQYEAEEDSLRRWEILESWLANGKITEDKKVLEKFWRAWCKDTCCLAKGDKKCPEILPRLQKGEPLEIALRNRMELGEYSVVIAYEEIRNFLEALIRSGLEGRVDSEVAKKLLFGKKNKKQEREFESVPLILDFEPTLQTQDVRNRMSEVLEKEEKGEQVCALTGNRGAIVQDTFPQVMLPCFSQKTSLLAMNKDIPCHNRYGRIAAEICSVGEKVANEMANALLWMTTPEMEGKTWSRVAREKKQKEDLFLVYCEKYPENEIPLAQTLGSDDSDMEDVEDEEIYQFLYEAEKVCGMLKNSVPECLNPTLRCIVIREVDKARRQILYADGFTTDELFQAICKWKKGADNTPDLQLYYPRKKKEKSSLHGVEAPYLIAVVQLYQTRWMKRGTSLEAEDVSGISFPVALELFLDRGGVTRFSLEELLQKLLCCSEAILSGVGNAFHRQALENISIEAKKKVLQTMATMGILLDKLGYRKENYMNDTAYLLGRLLSYLDSLHVFYCQTVRNGDIPPQLLGNSFLSVVCDRPAEGIGRLLDRVKIYQAWANKYACEKPQAGDTDEDRKRRGLVRWLLSEIGSLTPKIHALTLSEKRMTAVEKSCLLLGYLAKSAKKETSQTEAETETKNTEQELSESHI